MNNDPLNTPPAKLPRHLAVIMDGNGRWAKSRGWRRVKGHEEGAESVRVIVRSCRRLGIEHLTLYAFSQENWDRPKAEVSALMTLLNRFLKAERSEMIEHGIRLNAVGDIARLPEKVRGRLSETMAATAGGDKMSLNLALSYGSRQEITAAVKSLCARAAAGDLPPEDIDEALISQSLYTAGMPDPDLLIRTSGERRISNFLLWQSAYSEIYFTGTHWPDFREAELMAALHDYAARERRFGKTGEQLSGESA